MNIAKLTALFLVYRYPVIFLIVIVEGAMIMTLSGFLLHLGLVSFWPIFFTLIAGDLVGDIVWYHLGYYFADPIINKYGKYFGLTAEIVEKVKSIFQNHEKKILFISKITMGFGFPVVTLLVAGMSRMDFKKYIGSLFLGQIFFTGGLIAVGYFFGDVYEKINKDLRYAAIAIFLIAIFFIFKGIRSYMRSINS